MRYLTLAEILDLHRLVVEESDVAPPMGGILRRCGNPIHLEHAEGQGK